MRIFDIEIYRDGGSIEFRVDRDSRIKHVWLNTPFQGEPRALRIDSVAISRGTQEARLLIEDIAEWWETLPSALQIKVHEVMAHKGPFCNPTKEIQEAQDVSRVLLVRDYVVENYLT